MQYMGGKSRIAKRIAPFLIADGLRCHTYLEPFIGGGSVFAEVSPWFETAIGSDANQDLILLWQALAEGWQPPSTLTHEEWAELRDAESSALRAFAGFGCSFGGKWFAGYARTDKRARGRRCYADTAARGLMRKITAMHPSPEFHQVSYDVWTPGEGTLVYCDPPYANTTTYGAVDGFDSDRFWKVAEGWAEAGATVFVSEYAAPVPWREVWGAEVKMTVDVKDNRRTAVEKLFTL